MKIKNILIALALAGPGSSGLLAQTTLQVDEVQVIKDFEARLKDFRKVNIEPRLPVFDISERQYEYTISSKPLILEYEKPSIRPLALPDLPGIPVKRGGFELGYGIPNAFAGSFSYGTSREDFSSSIAVRHHSANNEKIEHQQYMHNALDLALNHTFSNDVSFDGNAFINLDYINLYGVEASQDTSIDFTSPRRRLIHWDVSSSVRKEAMTESIDGMMNIRYRLLHNNMEQLVENGFTLDAGLDFLVNERIKFTLPVRSDVILSQVAGTQTAFGISPAMRYQQPYFNLELGGEFVYGSSGWVIFPEILVTFSKLWGYFDLFAGAGQETYLNGAHFKTTSNPFYRMSGDTAPLTYEQGYFAGVRGDIEGAKFEAGAHYSTTSNAELFVPSAVDARQFDVRYDKIRDFFIEGSVSYEITRNITLSGTVVKHFYEPENELKAWHRPDLDADFTARFSFFRNKLLVDGSLFFATGLHYPDPLSGQPEKLPVLFDVSGKAQYTLFRNFRLFVQWNNITATKYNRWYQYPSYRIHLIGGVKLQF
jgi:hypothetical protein